jgi:hypothetical protein
MTNKKYFLFAFFLISFIAFFSCQKDYNKPNDADSGFFGVKTEVYVKSIVLDQYPALAPSGFEWDSTATDSTRFPDFFYSIFHDPDTALTGFYQSTKFDNVEPSQLPLGYLLTTPFKIFAFDSTMTMNVYDYEKIDTVPDIDTTLMTSFTFTIAPGDSTIPNANPYPESIDVGNADYRLRLFLLWK